MKLKYALVCASISFAVPECWSENCAFPGKDALVAKGVTVNGVRVTDVERCDFAGGYALRYRLPAGSRYVGSEDTAWTLPCDAHVWYQPGILANGRWHIDYEASYTNCLVKDVPVGTRLALPLTARTSDGGYLFVTEANVVDWTDSAVRNCGGGVFVIDYYCETNGFVQSGADVTPWRVYLRAEDINQLGTNDVVRKLCPSPSIEVAARNGMFVRPGRAIWHWLPSGEPVFSEQKVWYDRTHALGFEYYLIDDGWKRWREGEKDQWACLKKWIDYGRGIGVGTFVWADSKEMPDMVSRRAYLGKVKSSGAVGVKIDFIPEPTCEISRWYDEMLRDAYELDLMVDFHGAQKPSGREKTWPNEVAREGVRGHEWHITRYGRVLPPEHDCILPFTRLPQGHADYTPVVFEKKELVGFTWARELAQGIVFAAPLLCFGDSPKNYVESPAVELIKNLPCSYDETRYLTGTEIGECVVVARRKDEDWFVAVENGARSRQLTLTLDFLADDRYELIVFADAKDRPDGFAVDRGIVNRGATLDVCVRSGGGYVAWLRRLPLIRIGAIADLHYAEKPDWPGNRYFGDGLRRLGKAVRIFNERQFDFAVELGDFKDNTNGREGTLAALEDLERCFSRFRGPRYHVAGNHDFDCLTPEEFFTRTPNGGAVTLNGYYSFSVKGVRFVVLDGCYESSLAHYSRANPWEDANVPPKQLAWLERTLADAQEPVVVFCHQPLDDKADPLHRLRNASSVKKLLLRSRKVKSVISGHQHWGGGSVEDGIVYRTLPAAVCGEREGQCAEIDVFSDGSTALHLISGFCENPQNEVKMRGLVNE